MLTVVFAVLMGWVYLIPLWLMKSQGSRRWTRIAPGGKLIIGAPLRVRVGLAMHALGIAMACPVAMVVILMGSREPIDALSVCVSVAVTVLCWGALWVLARAVPMRETTIDLQARTYTIVHRWPRRPDTRVGTLDEFAGVCVEERGKQVYLVSRDWAAGKSGAMRICMGSPASIWSRAGTQGMRAMGFAVEMSEMLGLPVTPDPRCRRAAAPRVRQIPITRLQDGEP